MYRYSVLQHRAFLATCNTQKWQQSVVMDFTVVAFLLLGLFSHSALSWSLNIQKLLSTRSFSFFRFIWKRQATLPTSVLIRFDDLPGIYGTDVVSGDANNQQQKQQQQQQQIWDHYFQELALQEAQRASSRGEVPVGAVVVQQIFVDEQEHDLTIRHSRQPSDHPSPQSTPAFTILARAGNQVEELRDASAHAELLAMRQAASSMENWRLTNCTLYTTLEPCYMCLAAAHAFRINRIVYGAPDLRLGGIERRGEKQPLTIIDPEDDTSTRTTSRQLPPSHPFHTIANITAGVCANESAQLLQEFFRAKRKRGKQSIEATV